MLIHSSLSVCLVEHVRCISTLGWKSKWEQDEFSHSIRLTVTERVSAIWEGCKSRHPREDLLLYFLHSSCCVTLCLTKAAIRLIDTSWLREKTLACSSVCFLLVDSCCCCWLFFFFFGFALPFNKDTFPGNRSCCILCIFVVTSIRLSEVNIRGCWDRCSDTDTAAVMHKLFLFLSVCVCLVQECHWAIIRLYNHLTTTLAQRQAEIHCTLIF